MNGLALLNPAGLLALGALAVPLLIHLFSRSKGRRVTVGNIALYRQARRQRVLEPRPVQWLLLLLRLLLLALVALLLAGLARPGLDTLVGDTAYVTPEWLAATDNPDAALANADQAFLLATGYPPVGGSDTGTPAELTRIEAPRPTTTPGAAIADPWSLLAERLATVRHAGEVHVHALAEGRQFPADAPALPTTLTWRLEPSDPEGDPATPDLEVRLLHAPDRSGDADRLAAALGAIAAHRRVNLSLTRGLTGEGNGPAETDGNGRNARRVIVWLGEEPAPADLDADLVLEDHPPGQGAPVAVHLALPALDFLVRPATPPPGTVRWRADDGSPVLVAQGQEGALRLHYLDRLDGDPDGPVARAGFPDLLLRLLLGDAGWDAGVDHAPADPTNAVARPAPAGDQPHRPLAPWLALAAALLFGLERWLSERTWREAGAPGA